MIKQYKWRRILAVLIAIVLTSTQTGLMQKVVAEDGSTAVMGTVDMTSVTKYCFRSTPGATAVVQFTAPGADAWESDDHSVATVDAQGHITAIAPGSARITARAGSTVVAVTDVMVPVVSENFEGMTAANPPSAGWSIPLSGLGTPTANIYMNAPSNGTYFGVMDLADAPTGMTHAFGFTTAGASGGRGRGVQKNFTPVKKDMVDLDFDWNTGTLDANMTWLSIKDSEFGGASSNNKGLRYLSLVTEYTTTGQKISYSVSGGRDAAVSDSTGATYQTPDNRQTLFTGVSVNTWYRVHVTLDFIRKEVSFSLTDKLNGNATGTIVQPFPADVVAAGNLDFGAFALLAKNANAVQSTAYTAATVRMYLDNLNVYGYPKKAPVNPVYHVSVSQGSGQGDFAPGKTVSVTAADMHNDTEVTGWTSVPEGLAMTRDAGNPFVWSFIMPASDVVLTPVYGLVAHDIGAYRKYYFKSDFYSQIAPGSQVPRVRFSAAGAATWTSDNPHVMIVPDTDPRTAVVTAGSTAGETAVITARDASGTVVGTTTVCMPVVSESFENTAPITPPKNTGWNIPTDGNGSPGENIYLHTTSGTSFGVVSMADGNKAFEFATQRGDSLLRGVQKNFTPVRQAMVELNFDWNTGSVNTRSMWLSIKDSSFAAPNSTDKGNRYLVLRSEYSSAGYSRLSFGTGGRDDNGGGSGSAPNVPANIQSLFGGADVPQNTWYNVRVILDYVKKITTFSLVQKATGETTGEVSVPFPGDIASMDVGALSIISQGAGNNVSAADYPSYARMQVDNFNIYSYGYDSGTASTVTVRGGTGSGTYLTGSKILVRAGKETQDKALTGWTVSPSGLPMSQSKADPDVWSFVMPDHAVTLEPVREAYDVGPGGQNVYYFNSGYFSAYHQAEPVAQAVFKAAGAVAWTSADTSVATVVAGTDPSSAVVTAAAPGMTTLTATRADGQTAGSVCVYVPFVSENFENQPQNAVSFSKWSITDGGDSGSPSLNKLLSTGYSQFGVVAVADADGDTANKAFEFASGRGDTTFRGVQKRFTPVKRNVVELNFDWDIGKMARTSTWLSIKDSEFAGDATSDKGFRYLALKVDYISATSRKLSYDSGKRDATNATGGNTFLTPSSTSPLFGGVSQAPDTWYTVHVVMDFISRTTTFSLKNKATGQSTGNIAVPFPADLVAAGNLDFGAIAMISAGAGDNSVTYSSYPMHMYVDNFSVYGYNYLPRQVQVRGALLDNGTECGMYQPGDKVTVTVRAPENGQAFRRWEVASPGTVPVRDAADPLKWTFVMPVNAVEMTAVYDAEYEIDLGSMAAGGAGQKRDITVIGDLTDKWLVIRLTTNAGGRTRVFTTAMQAEAHSLISYQRDDTKVEVMLTDSTGQTVYTSVQADPANP